MNIKSKLFPGMPFLAGIAAGLAVCAAQAAPAVPLTGAFTYGSTLEATGNPACQFARILVGTGTISHVGRAALVATDCIERTPGSFVILSGNLTFTAVSGEKLYATYSGMLVATGGPVTPGTVYEWREVTYNLTGGTGRFVGAKGTGKLEGSEDMAARQGSLTVRGSIAY